MVLGKAGTCKSILVNTIVTALQRKFPGFCVDHIIGRSGCAALNTGGQTVYKTFFNTAKQAKQQIISNRNKKSPKNAQAVSHFNCW